LSRALERLDSIAPVPLLHQGNSQKEVCFGVVGRSSKQSAELLHCL
jgi:hypothetical protein